MELNSQQKKAVESTEGAVLVFAGAGSGKTMVIMHRIIRLIKNGVPPYNILAVTFTNKAAEEMKNRIKAMAGPPGASVLISTFHSLANRILRYDGDKDFTIYDSKDQIVVIKDCLKKLDLDPKHYPPAKVRAIISNAKNDLMDVESFLINASAGADGFKYTMGEIYREYQALLERNGGYDFGDLLVECIRLLKTNKKVRDKYRDKFRYIMVDEYQDTNYAQYVLIKTLAPPQNNICAVGDDDQSIYMFRGASLKEDRS
ncbi:MAG: ATP-dependent helicase [Elusimicrobiota bacterium]